MRRKNLADPIERRYQRKRRRREKSSARSLHKRNDRSRFEARASEVRDEQEQYAQRRRVFMAWAQSQASTLGAVIPLRHARIDMDLRFASVNPAVSFSISSATISVAVSIGGRWAQLVDFDSEPCRVSGGYIDDRIMPEYIVVYPDLHALWLREVFDYFERWYVEQFAVAAELVVDYVGRFRYMAVALYPGRYVADPGAYCLRMPLFVRAAKAVNTGIPIP